MRLSDTIGTLSFPAKTERYVLTVCVLLSVIVHSFFALKGFGEKDAARLAISGAGWHQMGENTFRNYTLYTSPLYLGILKGVLDLGFPLKKLPLLMNYTNVIAGSLCLIPLFLLWRRLANPRVAAISCIMYSFTPAFWLANTYGMPHLPAFAFFMIALCCFVCGLKSSGKLFAVLSIVSILCAVVAVNLKADIILCFGAFFGVMIYLHSWNRRNVTLIVAVLAIALLSVVLNTRMIEPEIVSVKESITSWQQSYPFTMQAILQKKNAMIIIRAVGICLFVLVVLSFIYCIIKRSHWRMLLMVLSWATPGIIFWGFKLGNSARHLMASYSILIFLLAVVLVEVVKKPKFLYALVSMILVLNYFSCQPRDSTISPSSRIFESQVLIQERINNIHKNGGIFASLPDKRKVLVDLWNVNYTIWEVLVHAIDFELHVVNHKLKIRVINKDDSIQTIRVKKPMK